MELIHGTHKASKFTLVITACDQWYAGPPAPVEDYNTAGLLQLRSVVFHYMKGSENEVCFLRYLLALMEFIHGTHKAPQDFITNMPDNVVTNILDRLPVQHAVRTSILSRSWRFKLLLHLSGAITKFVLCINDVLDAEDINHWILFLSRKGIKDLTIRNGDDTPLMLPTHLFSCLELKHVHLFNCCFNPPPTFHGFPNLLSLDLGMDFEENVQLGEFFTKCPLLEILTMEECNVKAVEIAKIKNLKILSLYLCDLDNISIKSSSSIFELVDSLPKLQELHLNFENCDLTEGGDRKRFSAAFPCLKVLKLSSLILDNGMELLCAFELIRSFTNLQTLEITAVTNDWVCIILLVLYSHMLFCVEILVILAVFWPASTYKLRCHGAVAASKCEV
uniref:Putative F-box domain, Leucine-rich repeat domain, L domain-like protein n=1 Tax=Helianthus annuus TaxID=4232 RepID=A0A251S2S1_HELAN